MPDTVVLALNSQCKGSNVRSVKSPKMDEERITLLFRASASCARSQAGHMDHKKISSINPSSLI